MTDRRLGDALQEGLQLVSGAESPALRRLVATLGRYGGAAALYEGAKSALATPINPVRERMSAFALRELLDDLEKAAGVGRKPRGLGDRVDALEERLRLWRSDGGDGSMPPHLANVVREFLADHSEDEPRRRTRARMTLVGLDPAGRDAPPAVLDPRVTALMGFRDDFNAILHGDRQPTASEFAALVSRFEDFLLGWLQPQPSRDLAKIDGLLEDGPPRG